MQLKKERQRQELASKRLKEEDERRERKAFMDMIAASFQKK